MSEQRTISHSREMDILKAIAIILVVLGHVGFPGSERIQMIFPEYGYHLAIFLFISGYLFRDIDCAQYPTFIWKKTKHLALPLLGWNLVYACIACLCSRWIDTAFLPKEHFFSAYNLLAAPFLHGHQYILNLATWFVGMLYMAIIIYGALHLLKKHIPAWLGMIFFFGLGILNLWYVRQYGIHGEVDRMLLRLPYALFFIHLGRCFRLYAKDLLDKIPAWILLLLFSICQYVIYKNYGITCYSVVWVDYQGQIVLPFVAGTIGIMIWYQIVRIWEAWIPENRLERVMSNASWSIMTHHMFVRFVVCYGLCRLGEADWNQFSASIWYKPDGWYALIVLAAIFLPTIWQVYFDKFSGWIAHSTCHFANKFAYVKKNQ